MNKISKIVLIVLVIGLLSSLPIIPVRVVPEVTLRVVNVEGKPMPNINIVQYWQHWSFESKDHLDESVSGDDGNVTFPMREIWISVFSLVANEVLGNTLGLIAIHSGGGPHSGFRAKNHKSENKWCYPCGKDKEKINEIVVLEENQ
jgi:hypothetical protein